MQWVNKGCSGPWLKKEEEKKPAKEDGKKVAAREKPADDGKAQTDAKAAPAKTEDQRQHDWIEKDGMIWFSSPGAQLNEQVIQRAEALIPGGRCLIDYSVKPIETLVTTLKASLAVACNVGPDSAFTGLIAAYGGGAVPLGARVTAGITLACSAFLWAYDKITGGMVTALKSQGYSISSHLMDKLVREASKDLRRRIEKQGGFARADATIKAMQAQSGPGAFLVRTVDGALLRFIDGSAQRFCEDIQGYQQSIVQLGTAAATVAKGGAR